MFFVVVVDEIPQFKCKKVTSTNNYNFHFFSSIFLLWFLWFFSFYFVYFLSVKFSGNAVLVCWYYKNTLWHTHYKQNPKTKFNIYKENSLTKNLWVKKQMMICQEDNNCVSHADGKLKTVSEISIQLHTVYEHCSAA